MLGMTLCWTSIPSRGSRNTPSFKAIWVFRTIGTDLISLEHRLSYLLMASHLFFLSIGTDANGFPLREEFAKSCFETLLQFSFVNGTPDVDQRVEQPGRVSLFGFVLRGQRSGTIKLVMYLYLKL